MLMSALIGRGKYPVPYDMKSILGFTALAALIFCAVSLPGWLGHELNQWITMGAGTVLLGVYGLLALKEIKKS